MQLSEYIEIGAPEVPHVRHLFVKWNYREESGYTTVAACPLCTAIIGAGLKDRFRPGLTLWETISETLEEMDVKPNRSVVHPVSGYDYSLMKAVIDLADTYQWSREQIVTWLKEIGQ